MRIDRTCGHCGRTFAIDPSQLKHEGYGQFCSRACHYANHRGSGHPGWKGGKIVAPDGYVQMTGMTREAGRNIREHVLIAERTLGHALPAAACVHHVNGNRSDNRPANLVICQDRAYHHELHRRQRIRAAGGNPNTDKVCARCRAPKHSSQFSPSSSRGQRVLASVCKPCAVLCQRERRQRRAA